MAPVVVLALLSVASLPGLVLPPFTEDSLHWDGPPAGQGFYSSLPDTLIAAARFTPAQACTVRAVTFHTLSGLPADSAFVYAQGMQGEPGPLRSRAAYAGAAPMEWTRVDFPAPYYCWANEDFWVGVRGVLNPDSNAVFSMDAGPMEHWRGGFAWIYYSWHQLVEWGQFWDRNWNLRAIVRYEGSAIEETVSPAVVTLSATSPLVAEGRLRYGLAQPGRVTIRVCDAAGRAVRTLLDGPGDAGTHTADWDRRDGSGRFVPAGSYFYVVEAGGAVTTARVSVVR